MDSFSRRDRGRTSAELLEARWSGGANCCWCCGGLTKRRDTCRALSWCSSPSSSLSVQAQWNISLDVLATRPELDSGRRTRVRGERDAARSRRSVSRRRRSERDAERSWSCREGVWGMGGGTSTWGDIVARVGRTGDGVIRGEGG